MTAETRQHARAERRCDHIALADKRGARASQRASDSVPIERTENRAQRRYPRPKTEIPSCENRIYLYVGRGAGSAPWRQVNGHTTPRARRSINDVIESARVTSSSRDVTAVGITWPRGHVIAGYCPHGANGGFGSL